MKENYAKSLDAVLVHEGGFVNNPKDPGGMTNLGCTKSTWESWVGHPVDEKAMRSLTKKDVEPLYKQKYWDKIFGDQLPDGVDYVVFDCAINSGYGRAIKFLQESVGARQTGMLDGYTFSLIAHADPEDIIRKFSVTRMNFLKSLPTWATFGNGWGRRVNEVLATALQMAREKAKKV